MTVRQGWCPAVMPPDHEVARRVPDRIRECVTDRAERREWLPANWRKLTV